MPIAVHEGRAAFDLPGTSDGGTSLVVVSCLGRGPGPYPIRLTAAVKSTGEIHPLPGAVDAPGPRRVEVGRPREEVSGAARGSIPPARSFHLLVRDGDGASASNYLAVPARLAAVGDHVAVYVDEGDFDRIDPGLAREVVATFDGRVYPMAARRFGPAEDVDGDGRFTIFVSGWLTRLAAGRIKVDGFVRGADFDAGLDAPFGNRCDMLYLSTTLRPGPHLKTVLAHEYTHAVTFSRKAFPVGRDGRLKPEEEGWLDEGLAHLVEDLHDFSRSNLDYRVSAFLSRPESYSLLVEDYYAADLFRSHGNRGAAYLFLRWCVDRQGEAVLDRLVRSGLCGIANLEAATGRSFPALYREWTVALYLSGLDPASDASDQGLYRSIDPRGRFGDWTLAGPRASRVKAESTPDSWTASGTSTHYALVQSPPGAAVRVEVVGPAPAELQVTVVPLPEYQGDLALEVRPAPAEGDGVSSVRVRMVAPGGRAIQLEEICWEPLVPHADARSAGFRRSGIDRREIERRFGGATMGRGTALGWRTLRLDGVRPGDGPLIFKAVGTDARGRRVAAWAELGIQPENSESAGCEP
jgi:hypothetical protein